eukprot:TRINITY_DN1656_c0_g1_i2.p1 TRINITY_DN1656_c0_g1~~TRINITY_DN1656_c0_g1_i2.p1  ORF type:complete len:349 (+),score=73.84 TRINITY_DN1656_c0_g1_i2:198-1244(+)
MEEVKPLDCRKMELRIGQWIDVKDTIDEWLEAQVTKIREGKVFVHYNGWGNNWDEWIDCGSSRIAPFRTYTLQYASSRYYSPAPNIPVDSEDNEIPAQNNPAFSELFDNISRLVGRLRSVCSRLSRARGAEERKMVAAQLAPLVDRTGRLLCDFAPHLAHLANPEDFRDEEVVEPMTYRTHRPERNYNGQLNLVANAGDVSVLTSLLDRVIFSDFPSLEVHVHAFLNSPSSSVQPTLSANTGREVINESLSFQTDTEMQTDAPLMCDYSMMTNNVMTHCSLGVQTVEEKKAKVNTTPRTVKIKPHAGHTIIRESPKVNKGKYGAGEFRITKTKLKMGPSIKKHGEHKQ